MARYVRQALETLTGTARIDPREHGHRTSSGRLASFGHAVAGCLYVLRRQPNVRLMALASILVFGLASWLGVDRLSWAVLILSVAAVWICEFINAAVEAAVNLASPEYHPMARVAKDVAAGAVLLAALASVPVGLLILGPPLLEKLGL
jgi:diacylglycerol kinase